MAIKKYRWIYPLRSLMSSQTSLVDAPGCHCTACRCTPGHSLDEDALQRSLVLDVKPFRQKGTGRARQGSIREPQMTGGGIGHTVHNRAITRSVHPRR